MQTKPNSKSLFSTNYIGLFCSALIVFLLLSSSEDVDNDAQEIRWTEISCSTHLYGNNGTVCTELKQKTFALKPAHCYVEDVTEDSALLSWTAPIIEFYYVGDSLNNYKYETLLIENDVSDLVCQSFVLRS